jgi:hypothetical protein
MTKYINTSSAITYVGGDTSGNVQTLLSGNTDNGTAIQFEYETKEFEFESRASTKVLQEFAIFMTNGAGSTVSVSEDGGVFKPAGQIRGLVTHLRNLNKRGHYFKGKVHGSNKATPVVLDGYEFVAVQSLGYLD